MVETIVNEDDEEAVAMLLEGLGMVELPSQARVIGFRDKDGMRGAFLFERYTGVNGSIHAHWTGRKGWLKGYMLTLAFMYAFDQLKCRKIFGEVHGKAKNTQKLDKKLGFREVARLEGYYTSDDLIIYELKKQDCAWLPAEFKEERSNGHIR